MSESVKSEVKTGKIDNWEKFSRYIILALAFLLPIWSLPIAGFTLGLSKSFLFFVFVLVAAVFFLINLLQGGALKYPKSVAFLALAALLLVGLFSSLFSGIMTHSFFGVGAETGTFFFLLFLVILLFLTTLLFQSEKNVLLFTFLLIVSSLVVFVSQILRSVFDIDFWGILPSKTDALIGTWNELAIFFGFIGLMSIVFLQFFGSKLTEMKSGKQWKRLLLLMTGLSIFSLAFVNFMVGWIVFATFILVFFVYLFASFGKTQKFAALPFFIILVSLFFILARPLMGDFVGSLGLNALEVRPSWSATYEVVKATLGEGFKNMAIGSGLNTFSYDWMKFKPVEINQTLFWGVGFQGGIGLIPSFIATSGILGFLCWLLFLVIFLAYGLKTVAYSGNDFTKGLLFSSFLGSAYLWVFSIIYTPGIFLLTLTFLSTGLFFALLIKHGKLKVGELSFFNKSSMGFVSALIVVLLLIASVSFLYLLFQKYWAVYSYGKGLVASNIEGDIDKAQNYFTSAVRFDKQPRYFRVLSEVGLLRLNMLVNQQKDFSQEEASSQFQNILAFMIQNAQFAVNENPQDYANWMSLGEVYRNVIPFGVNGAKEAALDSYSKALERAPKDPRPFYSSAQAELDAGENGLAVSFLNQSLGIKSNYTQALFLLAKIAAQEGDLKSAISQTELARLTAPNDVGVLFQLGLLYYQNKDYGSARSVLERTVSLSPAYSNARYFLGLAYDKENQEEKAIEQFEQIKVLNPGNEEVDQILSNLKAGRRALSSISPPEPAPEEREDLPIEEGE
ncbi:MAG: tetratricopeptide repeat protein [Patescibacteria group bacterium]